MHNDEENCSVDINPTDNDVEDVSIQTISKVVRKLHGRSQDVVDGRLIGLIYNQLIILKFYFYSMQYRMTGHLYNY